MEKYFEAFVRRKYVVPNFSLPRHVSSIVAPKCAGLWKIQLGMRGSPIFHFPDNNMNNPHNVIMHSFTFRKKIVDIRASGHVLVYDCSVEELSFVQNDLLRFLQTKYSKPEIYINYFSQSRCSAKVTFSRRIRLNQLYHFLEKQNFKPIITSQGGSQIMLHLYRRKDLFILRKHTARVFISFNQLIVYCRKQQEGEFISGFFQCIIQSFFEPFE